MKGLGIQNEGSEALICSLGALNIGPEISKPGLGPEG